MKKQELLFFRAVFQGVFSRYKKWGMLELVLFLILSFHFVFFSVRLKNSIIKRMLSTFTVIVSGLQSFYKAPFRFIYKTTHKNYCFSYWRMRYEGPSGI